MRVVAAVENGEEAVHLASSGQIDVLLLDVEMPRMTGAEALPIIKHVAPGVRVVMHSSRCSPEEAARLLDAGASACLAKPCDLSRILDTVRAVAGAHCDGAGP